MERDKLIKKEQVVEAHKLMLFGCTAQHAAEKTGIKPSELKEIIKSDVWKEMDKARR